MSWAVDPATSFGTSEAASWTFGSATAFRTRGCMAAPKTGPRKNEPAPADMASSLAFPRAAPMAFDVDMGAAWAGGGAMAVSVASASMAYPFLFRPSTTCSRENSGIFTRMDWISFSEMVFISF